MPINIVDSSLNEATMAKWERDKEKKRQYDKEYRSKNADKRIAQALAWAKDNPYKRHGIVIKRRYGLSLAQYDAMILRQEGRCAICEIALAETCLADTGAVDHCHSTGAVRGILCRNCNSGLGLFQENIEALARSVQYLTAQVVPRTIPAHVSRAPRNTKKTKEPGTTDRRMKIPDSELDNIIYAISNGESCYKLASKYGVTPSAIYRIRDGFRSKKNPVA